MNSANRTDDYVHIKGGNYSGDDHTYGHDKTNAINMTGDKNSTKRKAEDLPNRNDKVEANVVNKISGNAKDASKAGKKSAHEKFTSILVGDVDDDVNDDKNDSVAEEGDVDGNDDTDMNMADSTKRKTWWSQSNNWTKEARETKPTT